MNIRSDLLRPSNPMNTVPQGMLAMNAPHLFPPQQQQSAQLGQQQPPPPHMGLLQNNPNPNPSLGLISSAQSNGAAGNQSVYHLQMQQVNQQRRQQLQQQAMSTPGLNAQNIPGAPHVNGLAHNHNQLQNIPFPNSMMQQASLRRVPSQPQMLSQSGTHIPGIHPNQPVVGGVAPMGGMPMNPQPNLPQQLRHAHQQQVRMQQQQSLPMQGQSHMSPDLAMGLNRQNHLQSNVGLQANMVRAASAQQLLGLTQSSPGPQHPGIIQNPMHTQTFQSSMGVSHSQPQQPMASSPRMTHAQGNVPHSISPAAGMPPQSAGGHPRINPDNAMFMNFQNSQLPHNPRLPPGNAQFTFAPSSTPPNQLGDISHSLNANSMGTPGQPSRTGLMTTPAEAFEQMNQGGDSFPFTHPISAPPRPPSQHASNPHFSMSPHQQQQHPPSQQQPQPPGQMLRSSPHQPDHTPHIPSQRPQSQPQTAHSQSPRQGPSRTPRTAQASLPGGSTNTAPAPRPATHSGQAPAGVSPPSAFQPLSGPPHPTQVLTRQSSGIPNPSAPATAAVPSQSAEGATHQPAQSSPAIAPQRPMLTNMTYPVGFGQGLTRLLQFSGVLANDTQSKLQLSYWDSLIKEYFTPKASLKFTLWKDNQRNEAKPFEIGVPILPRFFLVTSQSGVKSMNLSLDGARERIVSHGHAVVECVHAIWTYRYTNGYTVTLRGPMTAHIFVLPNSPSTNQAPHQHVSYTLKFDQLQFDANYHDKLIAMEAISGNRTQESPRLKAPSTPMMNGGHILQRQEDEDRRFEEPRLVIERASVPAEPVNAFGIPQATMRCLELAESVAQMSPLIQYSTENKLGPLDALTQYARKLREAQGPGLNGVTGHHGLGIIGAGFGLSSSGTFDGINGVPATPPVTLYPGTPLPSTTSVAIASTSNGPSLADGISKNKPTSAMQPQPPVTPNSGPAVASTPASAPTPTAATSTPSITHATLKRKAQGSDGTPSTNATPEAPAPKRPTRKRGRTGGG